MKTQQERAWAGDFGDAYNRRSPGDDVANAHLFDRVLHQGRQSRKPESVVELGAGQGANLRALRRLLPQAKLTAVEINRQACGVLAQTTDCTQIVNCSLLDWQPERTYDLAFTKGVLIHVAPDFLGMAYETIHRAAQRWILLAEYYAPKPEMILYRGEEERLWKRDFAGEMLDRYADVHLVDYGFVYHRDRYPQDDISWFLMEKR